MKTIACIATAVLLGGCMTAPSKTDQKYEEEAKATTQTCATEQQCMAVMQAARDWLKTKDCLGFETDDPLEVKSAEPMLSMGIMCHVWIEQGTLKSRFGAITPMHPGPQFLPVYAKWSRDLNVAVRDSVR